MKNEQVGTLLQQLKERAQSPQLLHLCEAFEAFVALYASRNQKRSNPEAFEKKLNASYRNMWESFYTAAETLGISGQQYLDQMVQSELMKPEAMQAMLSLSQSIEAVEGPAPKSKKKKSKKNVRI